MAFPDSVPTSRSFSPGNWPIRTFRSQNGIETRILYGNKRTGLKLQLSYKNVADSVATEFLNHYYSDAVKGTYNTFDIATETLNGYLDGTNNRNVLEADHSTATNSWRYSGPPQVRNVKPGRSTVTVNLVGVLEHS